MTGSRLALGNRANFDYLGVMKYLMIPFSNEWRSLDLVLTGIV